jgi:hypothetical protein
MRIIANLRKTETPLRSPESDDATIRPGGQSSVEV